MDYGIIFVIAAILIIIAIICIIILCNDNANQKREDYEREIKEYLNSLTPEEREIELKLMDIRAKESIRNAIAWQNLIINSKKDK